MMLDVSVIVPVYGVEKYIERCARSILEQSHQNFEVIFVNDCSKDRSEEILNTILAEYDECAIAVRLIKHEVNGGISAARETGLKASKGQYILYVDSDDFIAGNMVSAMLEKARSSNADIVVCDYYEVKHSQHIPVDQSVNDVSPKAFLRAMLSQTRDWTPWNKLFRRELAIANDVHWPIGINMAEDLLVMVKLFTWAESIAYVNQPLYYYNRDNINSLVNTISVNACRQSAKAIKLTIEFVKQQNLHAELSSTLHQIQLMLRFNMLYTQDSEMLRDLINLFPESNRAILKYRKAGLHWRLLMFLWIHRHTTIFESMLFLINLKNKLKQRFSNK